MWVNSRKDLRMAMEPFKDKLTLKGFGKTISLFNKNK